MTCTYYNIQASEDPWGLESYKNYPSVIYIVICRVIDKNKHLKYYSLLPQNGWVGGYT